MVNHQHKSSADQMLIRTKRATAQPPAYRQREGYSQAIVTLTDSRTKKRRDYWLGDYGSPESRENYHRFVAEWEAAGRRLPDPVRSGSRDTKEASTTASGIAINALIGAYWRWAKTYYSPSELSTQKSALRLLRRMYGTARAYEFGPNKLRLVRQEMIRGDVAPRDGRKPRVAWCRKHVNGQIHRTCAVFKWAASHEMISASIYQQLKTVPALRKGRSEARETEPIGPVAVEIVDKVKPYLSRQVRALVDLQLLTGARGGELFKLRAVDIKMDEHKGIWTINLLEHKTAHHGLSRTIFLGPKAQAVIQPFLIGRAVNQYLFSPAEAEAERLVARFAARKTSLSCGNVPGSNRVQIRKRSPGDHYTADSYRRAIERACDQAFSHLDLRSIPRRKLTSEQRSLLAAWRREHRWNPHQLRHTAATLIRREFGLEAARIALGHSSALVTDAVYAERDMEKVSEMMRKIG